MEELRPPHALSARPILQAPRVPRLRRSSWPSGPQGPLQFWRGAVSGGASSSQLPRLIGAASLCAATWRRSERRPTSRRGKADARDSPEQDALEPGDEGDFMEFDEEDDEDWDEESFAMRFEDDEFQESASVRPPPGLEEFEEDWDDLDEGFGMPFSEEDDGATEGDENRETSGFVGSVFDGMDAPAGAQVTSIPSYEELSLLYDDFPVQGQTVQKEPEKPTPTPEVALKEKEPSRAKRTLEYMEEREYEVIAEGIAVRTLPDERSPRTGEILRQGEKFTAIEAQDGRGNDPRLYLRLPEGRGWVFNDEKIYPGLPSVKLTAQVAAERLAKKPTPVKRPLVAVVGRPNVGKSTLVNRICDVPDVIGGITHDEISVTHDRTYKQAEHTDDCGDTYLFDVVDAGGMVFEDSLETVTFQNEIKFQIDVALREACAAVMAVDGNVGVTSDDLKVAEYLKKTYISKGLRVVLAVAKCDRLESMDIKAAEFWELGLGEPIPLSAYHRRGVWECVDALINRGCNGLFPLKSKDGDQITEPRDNTIKVAICGKPNSGKSSLFNALVGEDRSIVSHIEGSTTDAVDAYLEAYNGNTYRFIDTAGITKRNKIKSETMWLSIHRSMKAIKRADVALIVLDASEVMTGHKKLGNAYWCPDIQMRYIARAIEERGTAAVIVLSKWDAVPNKDSESQEKFIQAIRSNLGGVGQWAEVVACSAKTGQRISKVLEAVDKTLAAHRKRIPTNVLNEVVRDALLWKLPPAKAYNSKQGRVYYATQTAIEPPQLVLFCNNPRLFGPNYKIYLENKIRQDLGWFGTPFQVEYRKRSEKRAVSQAEQWLGPRLLPSEAWR